jgi:hypothetical protein
MPLSQQEEAELAAIEQELQTRQAPAQNQSGLTPEEEFELAQIESELSERQANPAPQVNANREADLGFVNRARYSIEPLESNRLALLVQEFGQENVMQDDKGNVFVKQGDQFRPVNKEGLSFADATEFLGAAPEMAGGAVGMVSGALGGAVTTGGAASIPAAMALGAAGGGLGSVVRQGTSAILGTPQVSTVGERIAETGLSAGLGGLFSGAGQALKVGAKAASPYVKEAAENISSAFKRTPKGETALDIASEIKISPEIADDIVKLPGDEVLSREVVQDQMAKLDDIAIRQNLPKPTYAQAAGGRAIQAEDKIMNTPLIGGKIRQQVDNQLKAVKTNLEKQVGRFIDEDSTGLEVGISTKELSDGIVRSTKQAAQKLYDYVEESGKDAMIGKRTLFNKYRDYAGELGLIDPMGKPTAYAADTGFTPDEFKILQSTLFDGINALNKNPSPKIRFQAANALRKTVNNRAEELASTNPNAARLLKRFGSELDKTTEDILNREVPKLGEAFKEASKNWAKYKGDQEFLESFLPDGVENIVKKTMNNTDNIKRMKELVGENHVKEIGKSYVKDILGNLSKSGVARADSALSAIKKNKAQIIESLGEDTYTNLVDNLYYLNRLNQPLSVSRPSMYSLLFNPQSDYNLKKLVVNVATSAKSYTEMKGMTGKDVAKKAGKGLASPITVPFKRLSESSPAAQGSLGNILTDETQRGGAYFVRGPVASKDDDKNRNVAGKKFQRKK